MCPVWTVNDVSGLDPSCEQHLYYCPFKICVLIDHFRPMQRLPTTPARKPASAGSVRRRRARPPAQLQLQLRTWGGKRAGAGRKATSGRAGVPHRVRPIHSEHHPVHVTMRAGWGLPSLRRQRVFAELHRDFRSASHLSFRIVHFSVQSNHIHLLVEAHDKGALSRGMAGLAIRLARSVNRALSRRGRVWSDRYHARALATPREVRHALVYVLMNWRKHVHGAKGIDPCASAWWFDGWRIAVRLPAGTRNPDDAPPVVAARTWLASKGWRRHGLLDVGERPRTADASS